MKIFKMNTKCDKIPQLMNSKLKLLSLIKTIFLQIGEYSLTVRATDSGSPQLSSTAFVNINILDVNDNPPILTQENYTFFVQVCFKMDFF